MRRLYAAICVALILGHGTPARWAQASDDREDMPSFVTAVSAALGNAFFSVIPDRFTFASGVGAWGTWIQINKDGSFTGYFSDTDTIAGDGYDAVMYVSVFHGRLRLAKKVSDLEYVLRLECLDVEGTIGEEAVTDRIKNVNTVPYGLENAYELTLYFPGRETGDLEEEFLGWMAMRLSWNGTPEELPVFSLYNKADKAGFHSDVGKDELPTSRRLCFWAADRDVTVEVSWGSALFRRDSDVYDPDLAIVAAALSMAAYNRGGAKQHANDARDRHGYYIEDSLRKLGFSEERIKLFSYPGHPKNQTGYKGIDGSDDDLAFSIADKPITIGGSAYNLIAVTLRGTGGVLGYLLNGRIGMSPDWQRDIFGNFHSRDFMGTKAHSGFYGFYEDVRKALEQYQRINGLYDVGRNKVLITGHSLGAAGANLLAAYLSHDESLAYKSNIYCYTFATPNCVLQKGARLHDFGNVFNVVNPKDGVTGLPTNLMEGFGLFGPSTAKAWKYGVVCAIPSDDRSGIGLDYDGCMRKFANELISLLGSGFDDPHKLSGYLLKADHHDPIMYMAWMKAKVPLAKESSPGRYGAF